MKLKITLLTLSILIGISGCSKQTDYAESATADSAATDAVAVAADATADTQSSNAVQEVQSPSQLMATQQSALEQNRKLVKSSQLSFGVEDVQKTILDIEKQLLGVNGYIEAKQLDYQTEDVETRNKLDGSVDVFEKIKPVATMTVRVPNAQVSAFLNSLLPMVKHFDHQVYEAKRYELKLLEEKMNTANESYGASGGVRTQLQILTEKEVQDRLNYSTISLKIYEEAELRRSKDINLNRVASIYSDPFFERVWASIKMGFIAVREVLVWLVMLWPLFVILAIGYGIYRKFFYNKKI